jgi:hypothetical protein
MEQLTALYDNWWIKYALVAILLLLVYIFGFERPLPILKRILIYLILIIGCFPLVMLAYVLPIIPSLLVALLLFVAVWVRRKDYKNNPEEKGNSQ